MYYKTAVRFKCQSGKCDDAPEMFAYNNMNDQSPFSFTINFLSGDFDNPYADGNG